jgi:hypothetical protein
MREGLSETHVPTAGHGAPKISENQVSPGPISCSKIASEV